MSIFGGIFGPVQKIGDSDGWITRLGGTKTEAGPTVTEVGALAYPVVWACVTLIADTLAQLPVDVFRKTAAGREKVDDHPAARLLNGSPNDEMAGTTLIGALQMHALLWGNGYALIQRGTRQNPAPRALWPLLPEDTRPDLFLWQTQRRLRYWTQFRNESLNLSQVDVLHVMGPSYDGILGISPIAAARQAVGLGLAQEKFGSKFFANDSRSGGFLQHPGKLGDKAVRNIQESYEKQGGPDKAFSVKVLEEGMKYVPVTIPPDDAQFLESRSFQVSEIARIYRVPLILLQMIEGATTWGTGIEHIMIAFARFTLRPWLVAWEQELGRKLLTEDEKEQGFYFKFNLNALLAGDAAARANFYRTLINIGVLTRNEARGLEDYNPIDGLDEPLVPLNMQTVEQQEDAAEVEVEDEPREPGGPTDEPQSVDVAQVMRRAHAMRKVDPGMPFSQCLRAAWALAKAEAAGVSAICVQWPKEDNELEIAHSA